MEEVEATVSDYFQMWELELRGESFNKAERNRRLQSLLSERSRGSVEFKHQNISAVLVELGYPYISGYKPRSNYQDLLREVVERRLTGAAEAERLIGESVVAPVKSVLVPEDILSILVDAPKVEREVYPAKVREAFTPKAGAIRNYLEIEARNSSLGRAGEELVLRFEHERLRRAGERKLADRIEHVAASRGDYLGYDILSFKTSGRERLIEVKTTRFGPMIPFFASRNEVTISFGPGAVLCCPLVNVPSWILGR